MSALQQGTVIAGKYELERLVGSGGMGSVWSARHQALDRVVAIKLIDYGDAPPEEARLRFEREARAVAQLDTRHVVEVYDYGIDGDTPYLVMELLKGESLATRLEREKRLSLEAASRILSQVAKGLRKAHEASLVHRDLKPANIFCAVKDDEEIVKILDFGIVKAPSAGPAGDATRTGFIMGSVHYMSPEQARGRRDIDRRADLWSIGVILFRALTGNLPFRGGDVGDVIVKICAEPVPVPSVIAPDLEEPIDRFFERALARSPDARFQTAQEMAASFSAIVREVTRSESPATGERPSDVSGPLMTEEPSDLEPAEEPAAAVKESTPWPPKREATAASMPAISAGTLVELDTLSFMAPNRARKKLWGAGFLVAAIAIAGVAFNWTGGAPVEEPRPAAGDSPPVPSLAPPDFTEPSLSSEAPSLSSSAAGQAGSAASGAPSGQARADAARGGALRPPKARPAAGAKKSTGAVKSSHSTGEKRLELP